MDGGGRGAHLLRSDAPGSGRVLVVVVAFCFFLAGLWVWASSRANGDFLPVVGSEGLLAVRGSGLLLRVTREGWW